MRKYWFKRRRYGYGWTPTTWQGWLTVLIYFVLILLAGWLLENNGDEPSSDDMVVFFTVLIVSTGLLFVITAYTAPKAKWRWGKRPDDDPKEDF